MASKLVHVRCGETLDLSVGVDEKAEILLIFLEALEGETTVTIQLEGKGAEVDTQVCFLGAAHERFAVTVRHVHAAAETRSRMHVRGAVAGEAQGKFWGFIDMLPGCDNAQGDLKEAMLLLSPSAKIETLPALEIAHHAVQASHSASLERVDHERLFYLTSRGLSEAQAFRLLVDGFFAEVLQKLPDSDSLLAALERKLEASLSSSASSDLSSEPSL